MNETAGDGLMAIFQDPDPRRHARAAVKARPGSCAGPARSTSGDDGGASRIAVHLGVNSGLATVGATKIEGANGARWTYTASGSVTIVAARLAALGAGGRDPGRGRHPGAAGRRVRVRGSRRSDVAERRGAGGGVPPDGNPAGSRGGHGLSGRGRAFRPRWIGPVRPAVPSSAAHGPELGAEVVPRQAPLVGPIAVRGEELVDRVEDRLGLRSEVRDSVSHAPGDQQTVAAPRHPGPGAAAPAAPLKPRRAEDPPGRPGASSRAARRRDPPGRGGGARP